MVFRTDRADGWDFWQKDLHTGGLKPLTISKEAKVMAAISRDGSKTAYATDSGVYVVETKTGSSQQISQRKRKTDCGLVASRRWASGAKPRDGRRGDSRRYGMGLVSKLSGLRKTWLEVLLCLLMGVGSHFAEVRLKCGSLRWRQLDPSRRLDSRGSRRHRSSLVAGWRHALFSFGKRWSTLLVGRSPGPENEATFERSDSSPALSSAPICSSRLVRSVRGQAFFRDHETTGNIWSGRAEMQ